MKMPANRIATSRIGSQVKPLAARCSAGVSFTEVTASATRTASRNRSGSKIVAPATSIARAGRHAAPSDVAAMIATISGTLIQPRTRTTVSSASWR